MIAATHTLRPADLFSRAGAARVLLLDTPSALEDRLMAMLASMSEGRYHPLHLQPRGSASPVASGYIERSFQGYHLCLFATDGECLVDAQGVSDREIHQAMRSLAQRLIQPTESQPTEVHG